MPATIERERRRRLHRRHCRCRRHRCHHRRCRCRCRRCCRRCRRRRCFQFDLALFHVDPEREASLGHWLWLTVGTAVAANSRGPQFESSHRKTVMSEMYLFNSQLH